ncbi:PTS sugar transporter subunit IIC [Endomicrobium proavitum]|uniref:PTS mannose/fructose/N-acetylgalactosamine-specific component IIC n=1 Tax=Endomicrobium proavitum TaxID=1408281 RepID=A0A0G3WFT6_9BACT|nr:PTS sugar transporter subunit IIC [Endomicrobium proavitum]AKL97471.1 PTS mannose/fructose/N-acetylgalactosamine-specific component IIC [Endomicrobium proavitum]
MIIENIFILAFIAALCSLDITAFGQFMISRPIFCAPLFGWLMGDITSGLWIGMIAEMVWINAIPMGVAVPIDITSIAILATYWASKFFPGMQEAAIWGIAFAVPLAYFYKEMDVAGRNFNIKIMRWVEKGLHEGKESRIDIGIVLGLGLFFLRIFAFYLFAMFIGGFIYQGIFLQFTVFILLGFKKAWYLLPVFGFGAMLYNFRSVRIPLIKGRNK